MEIDIPRALEILKSVESYRVRLKEPDHQW
jgi:hypothetical protein